MREIYILAWVWDLYSHYIINLLPYFTGQLDLLNIDLLVWHKNQKGVNLMNGI